MTTTTALDRARASVAEHEAATDVWSAKRAAAESALSDLEERLGDEILAAGDESDARAVQLREDLTRLRSDRELAIAAIASADRAVDRARRDALIEAAALVRHRARAQRRDVGKRRVVTEKLLADLAEHEGVAFEAVALFDGVDGMGGWNRVATVSERLASEADASDLVASELETAAKAGTLTAVVWAARMAKGDPDGPEASELVEERAAQAEIHAAEVAEVKAIEQGRRDWIAERTRFYESNPSKALGRHPEAAAQNDYAVVSREHPADLAGEHEAIRWALERLGSATPVDETAAVDVDA